jgi:hypothetical protein
MWDKLMSESGWVNNGSSTDTHIGWGRGGVERLEPGGRRRVKHRGLCKIVNAKSVRKLQTLGGESITKHSNVVGRELNDVPWAGGPGRL